MNQQEAALFNANLDFFRRMIGEGFTSVAQAHSENCFLFAFYKPPDTPRVTDFVQVPTFQVIRGRALPVEVRYSEEALKEFLRRRDMALEDAVGLVDVLTTMSHQAQYAWLDQRST